MSAKNFSLFGLALLIMVTGLLSYSVVPSVYAEPSFDQGCYCHNNGIGVWFNGTGFNEYGGVTVAAGDTFVLNVTSENIAATGVVPGVQQWLSNMTDNAKFTFKPTSVNDSSALNLKHQKGNITAIYTITAPSAAGNYLLTMYAEGTMIGFGVQVTGSSASTSTTSTPSTPSTTSVSSSPTTISTSPTNSISSSSITVTSSMITSSTPTQSATTATSLTTTKSSPAAPSVSLYWSELAVIVLGFCIILGVALWRYRKS